MTASTTEKLSRIAERKRHEERRRAILAIAQGPGVTGEMGQHLAEELAAINDRMEELAQLEAPPPASPAIADIGRISPADAARRAAEIRADPRYWNPSKANASGKRLTAEEHGRLVQEHSELLARAAEGDA